jgi:hypothetical protein
MYLYRIGTNDAGLYDKKFALIGFPLTLEIQAVYYEGLSSEVGVETVPLWRELHFKST